MHQKTVRPAALAILALAGATATATAAPVTLSLSSTVVGYEFIDLGAFLPVGAPVTLSLTFNETFSDGTYDFSDALGPVTGSMTVGSNSFTFDGVTPFSYQGGFAAFPLDWVMPQFTGTGPTLGGGELYGLFAQITPGLTLDGELRLGYGFPTTFPDGFTITNFGYARIAAGQYSITPAHAVPAPSTALLALLALAAAGALRHRAAGSAGMRSRAAAHSA